MQLFFIYLVYYSKHCYSVKDLDIFRYIQIYLDISGSWVEPTRGSDGQWRRLELIHSEKVQTDFTDYFNILSISVLQV